MRRAGPWYILKGLWLAGILLYGRSVFHVYGPKTSILGVSVLGGLFLFIGLQFIFQAKWVREWEQKQDSSDMPPLIPSEGAQFYYGLGVAELFCVLIFLDIAAFEFLVDAGSLWTIGFGIALGQGLLRTSRRLAPISDATQHNAKKMAELGLPYRATDEEMMRVAIVVIGFGVILTFGLCFWLLQTPSESPLGRPPWWLGIPTLAIAALSLLRWAKRSSRQ